MPSTDARRGRTPTPTRPDRWRAVDWALAGGYAIPAGLVLLNEASRPVQVALAPLALLALVSPMGWRRRWPGPAVATQLTGLAAVGLLEPRAALVGLVALTSPLYLAATGRPRLAFASLAGALAAAAATALPDFHRPAAAVLFGLTYLVVWAVGFWVGTQRRHVRALLDHQQRLGQAELDHARALLAEERLRIARDLHDIVAHSVSVITVQAAFGRLVAADDPDQASATLATIETTGRETLVELRQLLQVVRDPDRRADSDGLSERAPTPGLADLEQLVARTAGTGLRLELEVVGPPRPLPAGIDTAAYRVIQEAVTNVVRHAGVSTASVVVRFEPDSIQVEVTDAGGRAGVPEPGYGLVGMRERVQLYGGSFAAGPLPGNGFRVASRFPLSRVDDPVGRPSDRRPTPDPAW